MLVVAFIFSNSPLSSTSFSGDVIELLVPVTLGVFPPHPFLQGLTLVGCGGGDEGTDNISQMIGSEEFLKMTADMMNSSLPMMHDESTQWDSSYAGPGKMLTYNYTLVNYSASQVDGSMFANSIRSTLADTICTTPATQIFPDNGVLLNFHYYDNTRNLIARVNVAPSDCK